MNTRVGLVHEPARSQPWLVRWWGPPDPKSGRQRRHSRSFRYRRDAQAFQAQKQTEIDSGMLTLPPEEVSLGSLLDKFREARLATLSHSSITCYENTFTQLIEYFGDVKKIRDIQQVHAESFISSRRRRDGRPGTLSTWSIAQHLKHCRALFGAAVDWNLMDRNPFRPVSSRGRSALHVRGKSRPWHHLRPEEFRGLLAATPDPRRRAVYWLLYGAGLRPGEAAHLTIDRIDLERRTVEISNRAATDLLPPFTVKADQQSESSKARTVPLPMAAMPDITEAMRLAIKAGGFIALSAERFQCVQQNWQLCRAGKPRGNAQEIRPWENRDMLNNLLRNAKADLKRAGIQLTAPFTLTTFRKSFAQNHADVGTPPKTLAALLGHSDVRVTLQYYNAVTDANRAAAAAAIDSLLASL